MKLLMGYNWPGNVRELDNTMERAMVTCKGHILTEECFSFLGQNGIPGQVWAPPAGMSFEQMERVLIVATLQRANGNIKETASVLGIDRSTLYEKIKRYEIPRS